MFSRPLLAALLLTTALAGLPAFAQELPARKPDTPVLLNADTLTYDDTQNTVTAEGHVQLAQGGQTVEADRMVFNRISNVVTADGNVRIWQSSGDVMAASHAELSSDLKQAFVKEVSVLMSDNSRFIALDGERTEGRYVRMNRALYTACDLCRDDPRHAPLWQVRAQRVIHDSEKHDVIYRNATLELGGVPVFYTPYLSHPDPSVKRRSGFLAPVIGTRNNLGFVARTYYYLDVAPSMDATIETSYSSDRGMLLGGEWRQRTEHGSLQINASSTVDDIPNDDGVSGPKTDRLRGHVFLAATHDFDANWRGTLKIRRTTDDTYLDLWNYSGDDVLPSSGLLERFTPASYGVARIDSYQDLRPGITTAEPNVLTLGYETQGEQRKTLGGRWSFTSGVRSIARSHGLDSQRLSLEAGWRREDVIPAGVVVTSEALARADAFAANNYLNEDPTALRPFAQGQLTARWPMVKVTENGQQFVEPIAQLTAAPRLPRDDRDIANEDSIGLEFDTSNLFRLNRYAGDDRLDGGQRVAYGLRAGWTGNSGASVTGSFGQSYDFADDPNFPTGSGLENSLSDYVGNVNVALPDIADASYALRLDSETFDPREHDLRAVIGPSWLNAAVNYLYIDQNTTDGSSAALREELGLGGNWKFNDYWSIGGYHRENLRSGESLNSSLALTYQDECMTFSLNAQRDYVSRTGLDSGDSVFFRLIFKNLGEFESPSINPTVFGRKTQS